MSGLSSVAHGMVRKAEDEKRRSQQSANIDRASLDALRHSTSAASRQTHGRNASDSSRISFFSRHRPSADGRQLEDPFETGALVEQTEPNTPAEEDHPSYRRPSRTSSEWRRDYFSPISQLNRKSCLASAGPDAVLEERARTDAHRGQLLTMPWSRQSAATTALLARYWTTGLTRSPRRKGNGNGSRGKFARLQAEAPTVADIRVRQTGSDGCAHNDNELCNLSSLRQIVAPVALPLCAGLRLEGFSRPGWTLMVESLGACCGERLHNVASNASFGSREQHRGFLYNKGIRNERDRRG